MKKEIKTTSNLLERVGNFNNIFCAFNECSRGKRASLGYMKEIFGVGERLSQISKDLLSNNYRWGKYRTFIIKDPKARQAMAAPFVDRVVHHAIHRVINLIVDDHLVDSVFACRKGKGNKFAVLYLMQTLKIMGKDRYVIKLDVEKYFISISHKILMGSLENILSDRSVLPLLWSLLNSYKPYTLLGRGIPIGNLTSQLFANFYLSSVDKIVCKDLGLDERWLKNKSKIKDCFYIRYMDDLVIVAKNKQVARSVTDNVQEYINKELELNIPFYKRVALGYDPVPFLGYVVDENGYRILARNQRRHKKHLLRLENKKALSSQINQVKLSYNAWCDLDKGKKPSYSLS